MLLKAKAAKSVSVTVSRVRNQQLPLGTYTKHAHETRLITLGTLGILAHFRHSVLDQ
jgi:hypothetical protein